MKRIALLLTFAVLSTAQVIPNRYFVELTTEPAASVSIAKRQPFAAQDRAVQAHRLRLENEHVQAERTIRGLGGTVTHHLYSVLNGMAVTMTPAAAARMAQMPGVRSVSPVMRHHILMDQALQVHRVTQAWQALNGGSAVAGAGIKIGILDTGIDATHPAFQNFSTPVPSGFPVISGTATSKNTNAKIIVARVYSALADGIDNTGTDGTDFRRHENTVAGIAAGLPNNPGFPGIGTISGVAPGAWLGNYKVQDDNGFGSQTTFLAGLEDALTDGMNVVNYSAGGPIFSSGDENGVEARAIANAVAAGMLVIVAAGNDGPQRGSIGTPAASPAAIAVGAIQNQRWFWFSATPAGGTPIYAIPPVEELTFQTGDVTGPLVDVGAVASGETHACSALPANSLAGKIALIQRGSPTTTSCLFQTKLNNAQTAGAIAAIVYDNVSRPFFNYALSGGDVAGFQLVPTGGPPQDSNGNDLVVSWSVGTASLPAVLVSQADGVALLAQAQGSTKIDLDFDGKTAMPYPSNEVSDFSSIGPTPGASIKPDIVAVGDWLVAPTSTVYEATSCSRPFILDLSMGCYPAYTFLDSPYRADFAFGLGFGVLWDDGAGTSFSTPMVTGAVALLMGARPGLTGPQYRSIVVNSPAEFDQAGTNAVAPPQLAGAGILDVAGALQQGLAANPNSLNFVAAASVSTSSSSSALLKPRDATAAGSVSETVTLTNIGSSTDTFTVTFHSIDNNAVPSADNTSFSLAAGASQTVTLSLPSGLSAGQYHGFMLVTGTQGQTPLRVPYWYGVAGTTAQNIYVLFNPGTDPSACDDVIDFRLLDTVGMPVTPANNPTVTTSDTRAQVVKVTQVGNIAGTFEAEVITGRPDANGNNTFTVSADSSSWPFVISIDNSGNTACSGTSTGSGASRTRPLGLKRAAHAKARRASASQ